MNGPHISGPTPFKLPAVAAGPAPGARGCKECGSASPNIRHKLDADAHECTNPWHDPPKGRSGVSSPVRHEKLKKNHETRQVGLPPNVFLYTLDQVATILSLPVEDFKSKGYVFYEGRSTYIKKSSQMSARNIAPDPKDAPVWRILDQELVRWMKLKGFRYYEAGVFYETDKFQED